jgi:phosphoribosylformylglycinamidine synthase
MRAIVNVYLKNGVLDPQGKAAHHALESLEFKGIKDVRIGKQIILELEHTDVEQAQKEVEEMCHELLANMVIEDYSVELVS